MSEMQTARLAADIAASVDARLRLLALVKGQRRIGRLLTDVLDKALPSAEELTAQLSLRQAVPADEH